MIGTSRCRRCGFVSDEKIPVGDDGLCLWCRKMAQGINLADFYTSGEWASEIFWDGYGPSECERLIEQVRQKKETSHHTILDIAQLTGLAESTVSHSLGNCVGNEKTCAGLMRYLQA